MSGYINMMIVYHSAISERKRQKCYNYLRLHCEKCEITCWLAPEEAAGSLTYLRLGIASIFPKFCTVIYVMALASIIFESK